MDKDTERGMALYRDGRYEEALEAFDDAVLRRQDDPAAYNNRAVARVRMGQLVGAVGDYTRAIQLSPMDPELFLNRGNAYEAMGNHDYAIKDYNRAVELAPAYSRAYFNRGTARLRSGDADGAAADWNYAIETETDPWAKAAMVRSAGLGAPAVKGPVASLPGVLPPRTAANPPAPPEPPQPSASPAFDNRPTGVPVTEGAVDAQALAIRGISRQFNGDHAGAISDLRAALSRETDPVRRDNIERLLRALETSR
jgi:tetratricopeptide (TPR) repeat protein